MGTENSNLEMNPSFRESKLQCEIFLRKKLKWVAEDSSKSTMRSELPNKMLSKN